MFSPLLLKEQYFLFVTSSNVYYLCIMDKDILISQINQGHNIWKIAELNQTTRPTIRYWLKKYDLKTLRAINQENEERLCLTCNIKKSQNEFYKRGKKYMSHCKNCYQSLYSAKRKSQKQQAVDYLGGKCSNCGYDKCLNALEFHHLNPLTKEINPSQLMRFSSLDKIKLELDKCVLLCANCHREHHSSDSKHSTSDYHLYVNL